MGAGEEGVGEVLEEDHREFGVERPQVVQVARGLRRRGACADGAESQLWVPAAPCFFWYWMKA